MATLQRNRASQTATFTNPLYQGADPWVTWHDGSYYLCQSVQSSRIEIWKSDTLTDRGERQFVWQPPAHGWNTSEIWAPELHWDAGRGKWFIYYAASDGQNANHRMGVLESATEDAQGPYLDRGPLYTGDDIGAQTNNRWAIDGTLLDLRGQLYFLWSGWQDESDIQHLYIARMSDPHTISSNRVRLCDNDTHLWERVGERADQRGLNEGPQLLHRNGRIFLAYSCSGSWQPTYKLGFLWMDEAADPMDPQSWHKFAHPAFESTPDVFGVGHCCFTCSPDGTEDWILYHSKLHRRDGWERAVHAQRFHWRPDGCPDLGSPDSSPQPLPSGDRPALPRAA